MTEKEEKIDEAIELIPLILFEKYIEITDYGIEYLKKFNNNVNIYILF